MKDLTHNTVSWVLLASGVGVYVAVLVMASNKSIPMLAVTAATIVVLLARNELNPKRRRLYRQRLGHCPYCNYDLQYEFGTGCPECGWQR